MRPETMHKQILGASWLLKDKTEITSCDYRQVLGQVTTTDLVYMDPPYQGVCRNRDPRYLEAVDVSDFVKALDALNKRKIRYLVSYDGRTGDKVYGEALPPELDLTLIELDAGRSSQATLLGRDQITIESLYLSAALTEELANRLELKKAEICQRCYWAFPENYDHIAMREVRRVDILWSGPEVSVYEQLREKTLELQKELPAYIKEIIESHLGK